MNTSKLLLHPARLRILQYIRLHGNISTTELLAVLRDIPRATVYHHVKLLEENGMIEVTAEKRIRGSVEKTYGIKGERLPIQKDSLSALSTTFHMELMQEIHACIPNSIL